VGCRESLRERERESRVNDAIATRSFEDSRDDKENDRAPTSRSFKTLLEENESGHKNYRRAAQQPQGASLARKYLLGEQECLSCPLRRYIDYIPGIQVST